MLKVALLALFRRKKNKEGSGKLDPFLASKPLFIEQATDEFSGEVITIRFACSCGAVVRRLPNDGFACPHCDRLCYAGNCRNCKTLDALDLWADDGGDDDSNL